MLQNHIGEKENVILNGSLNISHKFPVSSDPTTDKSFRTFSRNHEVDGSFYLWKFLFFILPRQVSDITSRYYAHTQQTHWGGEMSTWPRLKNHDYFFGKKNKPKPKHQNQFKSVPKTCSIAWCVNDMFTSNTLVVTSWTCRGNIRSPFSQKEKKNVADYLIIAWKYVIGQIFNANCDREEEIF